MIFKSLPFPVAYLLTFHGVEPVSINAILALAKQKQNGV